MDAYFVASALPIMIEQKAGSIVNVSGTVSQLAELMSPGIASVMKETGAVQQLTTRGMTLMEDRKFDEAIAELGKAVTLARHNLYAPTALTRPCQ